MKQPLLVLACGLATFSQAHALEVELVDEGGGAFTITWESTPSNPGDATPIYYAFRLEETADLLTGWTPVGTDIPTRIGGTSQTESITVNALSNRYYRLAYQVDLSGQDLSGSDFSDTSLAGANLQNTSFAGADLTGAVLLDTNLEGTDFTAATLDGAVFSSWSAGNYQMTSFGGAPTSMVADLPEMPFLSFTSDFATNIVGFENIRTSQKTLVVRPAPGTTIGDINTLLTTYGARIGGTLGSSVGVSEPLIAFRFDAADSMAISTLKSNLLAEANTVQVLHDFELQPQVLPSYVGRPTGSNDMVWTWNAPPTTNDWNWGMKYARIPAMWDFNDAVEKLRHEREQGPNQEPVVVVLDFDFDFRHPEFDQATVIGNPTFGDHGTYVASIVGAEFTSHRNQGGHGGMEGVDPFCNLHFMEVNPTFMGQIKSIVWLQVNRGARVVNCSFAYSWTVTLSTGIRFTIQPNDYSSAQTEITEWAGSAEIVFDAMRTEYQVPFIVIAAGNDGVDAQWGGPMNQLARAIGSSDVLTVGAQDLLSGDYAGFSNTNVDMMAAGTNICGASFQRGYARKSGTSFAAPFVTGLASYLLHLNPQLSNHELKRLITLDNIVPPGPGGNPTRMNAFQSVLLLDTIAPVPEKSAKLMLLDIDDGTPDGNLRLLYSEPVTFLPTDPPETELYTKEWTTSSSDPGGLLDPASTELFLPGDGNLDMADFRKWRDSYHYSVSGGLSILQLDGGTNHPKLDANHNGVVDPPSEEGLYSRADFNGDGLLTATVPDPQTGKTDLDILMESGLWGDAYVPVADLPALVNSGDLRIVPTDAVTEFVPAIGRVLIEISGGGWVRTRDVSIPNYNPFMIWHYHIQDLLVTLPVGTHTVKVTFEYDDGSFMGSQAFERLVTIGLCEDVFFAIDFSDLVF